MRSISIAMILFVAAAAAFAQAPTRSRSLVTTYDDVRGGMCSTTMPSVGAISANTPPSTLLFNRTFRGQPMPVFCDPLLNPDGTQMTLAQYSTGSGKAAVKCLKPGTHSVFSFTGLRPNGTYTVWITTPDSMPGPPTGVGELGRTGYDENTFTADGTGNGEIGAITPAENLSIFGSVGQCQLDAPLVYELVYHGDNQTHGGDPGPPNTWVTNAIFIFP